MSSNPELPESLGEPIEVHSDLEHHGKDHKVARHVSASGGITGERLPDIGNVIFPGSAPVPRSVVEKGQ